METLIEKVSVWSQEKMCWSSFLRFTKSGELLQVNSQEDLMNSFREAEAMRLSTLVLFLEDTNACARFQGTDLDAELVGGGLQQNKICILPLDSRTLSWQVKNNGKVAWTGVEIVQVTGRLEYNPSNIQELVPGEVTSIQLRIQAPLDANSRMESTWQLRSQGIFFGPRFKTSMKVERPFLLQEIKEIVGNEYSDEDILEILNRVEDIKGKGDAAVKELVLDELYRGT